jgi:hypothetical protein
MDPRCAGIVKTIPGIAAPNTSVEMKHALADRLSSCAGRASSAPSSLQAAGEC